MEKRWLVEYVGAIPCPVYATGGTFPTCNPWDAVGFDTEEKASAWMTRKGVIPYLPPWKAVSHGFEGGK